MPGGLCGSPGEQGAGMGGARRAGCTEQTRDPSGPPLAYGVPALRLCQVPGGLWLGQSRDNPASLRGRTRSCCSPGLVPRGPVPGPNATAVCKELLPARWLRVRTCLQVLVCCATLFLSGAGQALWAPRSPHRAELRTARPGHSDGLGAQSRLPLGLGALQMTAIPPLVCYSTEGKAQSIKWLIYVNISF